MEIIKTLENVVKNVIEWGRQNTVAYDILKTEAVFVFQSH